MRLLQTLSNLLFFLLPWIISSAHLKAQSSIPPASSRSLDALLQDYAFRAFLRPHTGIPYHGDVPSNFTGIQVTAMRLRSGSLRTRGVQAYNEFQIPVGVVVQPYVERLVLVYQNLANWSSFFYPLPGYTYLTPVLGLLTYDASNLSATNLPELEIKASDKPILIRFPQLKSVPLGSTPQCVWFDLHGLAEFSNLTSDNVCSTLQQGHFSVVAESSAPSVPPPPPDEGSKNPTSGGGRGDGKEDDKSRVWIIAGSVVGGLVLLVLLSFLAFWVQRYKHKNQMQQMEKAAEVGEALHMTSVGNTRAPVAMGTRTQPVLENEYVP
ncbi:hypothetical protein AQUCO_01600433v1 [Aquilegia coerulea]|uniref:Malectin-like domain-containing protein n=1 Tax=Aquilegia coerulea TaxID=218851 RepID=A0A2G5DRM4_AQUCA|nr:hypothetical protein AQUCO_01600433v1 [Aquilegia coerulea]